MNRSKKPPKPAPIVERGREHHQFVNEMLDWIENGNAVCQEDQYVLVTEIRDLRAQLSALTRGVPVSIGAEQKRSHRRSTSSSNGRGTTSGS